MAPTDPPPVQWAPRFYTMYGAQALAVVGNRLVQFALVWWITSTTGSAAALASTTLFVILPQIVLGPFIGALVDRWNRRKIMIVADAVMIVASAALGIVAWKGHLQVGHVYMMVLLRSTAEQFAWTSLQSSTSLMVPETQLARIAGITQTIQGGMNIAAPALGAILVSWLPIQSIMPVQIALGAIAVTVLGLRQIPQPAPRSPSGAGSQSVLEDMQEGFRFLLGWRGLTMLIVGASLLNLLGQPSSSLMPLFVKKELGGGALQLGWLESAMGGGLIAGGLLLGAWGGFRRRIYTMLVGLCGSALGTLMLAVVPSGAITTAMAAMLVTGLSGPLVNGPLFAVLQAGIPPRVQGRVFTAITSINMAAAPIGLLLAAPVADHLGLRLWYGIAGIAILLLAGAFRLIPAIVHLEEHGARLMENPTAPNPPSSSPESPANDSV
jgi:MFS transporter, DHA3 family, macrolide efflux protein